ncbi:MAG: adenosine kinase [Acidimicrobiia bacterium]
MSEPSFARPDLDVLGVGNALVDVISHETDEFIAAHDLTRGATMMVELDRVESVYADLGPAQETSGGSAANTMAGLASFGASAAYVGRVRNDQLGAVFAHDLRALGVRFDVPPATAGPATGRCLVMVTPDAQRTMCTYLGASSQLGPEDVDESLVAGARITYLEGYLWDQPPAKAAIRQAATAAHAAGRRVALTLSDPFCVERHRAEFRHLVEHEVDVLLANENEIRSLYEVGEFESAVRRVRGHCEVAALTRSEKGSLVVAGDDLVEVAAHRVARVVDTTGAGDQYAAGFMYGLTRGLAPETCGRLGSLAAAEVISHLGARPETSLAELARSELEVA